jgi:hypothetical protein
MDETAHVKWHGILAEYAIGRVEPQRRVLRSVEPTARFGVRQSAEYVAEQKSAQQAPEFAR